MAANEVEARRGADDSPDLMILLVAHPGEFSAAAVEEWRHRAPLARVVALLGAWCEGEARSGHPWPAIPRIYWHQWVNWFAREMSALEAGICGTLSLPITATDEERLLHPVEIQEKLVRGTIGVYVPGENGGPGFRQPPTPRGKRDSRAASPRFSSDDTTVRRDMAAMLVDVCRELGYEAVCFSGEPSSVDGIPLVAAIWDASLLGRDCWDELRALTDRWRGVPWIALCDFPRQEDRRRAIDRGARELLSKPLLIADLRATLGRLAVQ